MEPSYIVIDDESDYHYDIFINETDKGTEYKICTTGAKHYNSHARREVLLCLLDDGNGYKITEGKISNRIDYSQIVELNVLLKTIFMHEKNISSGKIIPTEKSIKY
jgi:hypothetical protein